MKRWPELQPLSREHQGALSLALRAKRAAAGGDEAAVREMAAAMTQAFAKEFDPHFNAEEEWLLPALRHAGEEKLVARTLDEHRRLRLLAAQLAEAPDAARLAGFAALLHDHVRFEERELFAAAQAKLAPDAL